MGERWRYEPVRVRVQPRSRREEVVGERDGAIVIRLTAPPVDGKANQALRRLVAKRAGVAKGAVEIVRGSASRDKLIAARGLDAAKLRALLLGDRGR